MYVRNGVTNRSSLVVVDVSFAVRSTGGDVGVGIMQRVRGCGAVGRLLSDLVGDVYSKFRGQRSYFSDGVAPL